jgi:hypothetical protein
MYVANGGAVPATGEQTDGTAHEDRVRDHLDRRPTAGRVGGPDRLGPLPGVEPAFREASGQVAVGNRITLRSVYPANGRQMTVKPTITVADPGAELRWVSSLPGIISGEHYFALTPADGRTRLEQSETFRGLLAAFSGKTFARPRRASWRSTKRSRSRQRTAKVGACSTYSFVRLARMALSKTALK